MKKILNIVLISFFVISLLGPVVGFAATGLTAPAQSVGNNATGMTEPVKPGAKDSWVGLTNCGFVDKTTGTILEENQCTFNKFMQAIAYLMEYLFWVVSLIMVGLIAWSGFQLLINGNSSAATTIWKTKIWALVQGLLWMLGAWLIVYTIIQEVIDPAMLKTVLQFFK